MPAVTSASSLALGGLLLAGLCLGAAVHLHRTESAAMTIYTTPALRTVLEKGIAPLWEQSGGRPLEFVYLSAGEEFNRLRMSGGRPEADLFLHASPLYLEKGRMEGWFLPVERRLADGLDPAFIGTASDGGFSWLAFAWSPLVEVYSPKFATPPSLTTSDIRIGLPHPVLSNNGVYSGLLLDTLVPASREHVLEHTVVQPVNARTNILGVADGSFDATLGYEAVAEFYLDQKAKLAYDWAPIGDGAATVPVVFAAALVDGPHPQSARDFVAFLFTPEAQDALRDNHFRAAVGEHPRDEIPADVQLVHVDWADPYAIDARLARYEVGA